MIASHGFAQSRGSSPDASGPAQALYLRQLGIMNEHNYFNSNCSGAKALAGQGNLLAIAGSSDNAVTLADVSDPSNPVLRASLKNGVAGYLNLAAPNALAIANNLLAIASESVNAVTLVDVTVPANPVLRRSADAANWNYNEYGSTTAIELYGLKAGESAVSYAVRICASGAFAFD